MLNRYLREFSAGALKKMTMNDLNGRKIAIDISIFLYQFKGNGDLLESMYKMIMLFRDYHVTPVFVFDGVPPDEKLEILEERDAGKKKAKEKCDYLESELQNNNELNEDERKQLEEKLNVEKKKCLHITNANIRDVKALIDVLGVTYLEADGEADDLCAMLVKKKLVWACMTEDMDMFVYGVPRVLRNFDLEKGTMTLYSMYDILNNLKMTQSEFRDICLLSGTDYNRSRFTVYTSMGFFYKFLKKKKGLMGFYDWLVFTKIINSDEKATLVASRSMFTKNITYEVNEKLTNKRVLKDEMQSYLDKNNLNYLINV
jgi:flap endonuclease-1